MLKEILSLQTVAIKDLLHYKSQNNISNYRGLTKHFITGEYELI